MIEWTQLRVACASNDLQSVCDIMTVFDSHLVIEDASDIDGMNTCYGELLDEKLVNADRSRGAVSIYIPAELNAGELSLLIASRLKANGIEHSITLAGLKQEDWADNWKKYYKPVKISKSVTVVPKWEDYTPSSGEKIIKMDPGMAFGTGTHETTRLCASLIEDYLKTGDIVLDVGTGSGILAAAASKLGAGRVYAYDIDPIAVRVADENISFNGCENVICGVSDLLKDAYLPEGGYDLVCANIVADIIIRMAPDVARFMKKGGILAVSGIIERQADDVLSALENAGLTSVERRTDKDWNALVLKKLV